MSEPGSQRWSADRMESLERIYNYLDDELTPEGRDVIQEHLQGCPECMHELQIENMLKRLVYRSCHGDKAPDGLADRIRARITIERSVQVRTRE